jgi:hypothetical protein
LEKITYGEGLFTVHPVLSIAECVAHIADAQTRGFEVATINSYGKPVIDHGARNNDRAIFDAPLLADDLWQRLRAHIPASWGGMQACGLNERFRYCRYRPGQRFAWHVDGSYERANGEKSLLTLLLYLNEGYEGGATRFGACEVKGQRGMALLFDHKLRHEGEELRRGIKYVLRSDVMFTLAG